MRRDWRHGLGDERGSVMALAAVGIAVLVAVAAFAVDLSNAYAVKGRLQNAADAAALAAAASLGLPEREAEERGRALALELAGLNVTAADGAVSDAADVQFGRWHSGTKRFQAGSRPYNAVKVTARRAAAAGNPVRTYFGGFFSVDEIDVEAEAIAVLRRSPCVIALDPSASGAFETTGTAAVRVPDCGIQVNSRASQALIARGASSVAAESICVAGGYSARDISPLPDPDCRLYPDPLAALPEPSMPAGCHLQDVTITRNLDLPAGTKLCGRIQIASTARVRLDPGIHYFESAQLHLAGQASIEGDEVMLYFDRSSSFHLASQGSVRLTPPSTGAYRGRLVTVRGEVRKANYVLAPQNIYGIEGYYIFWLKPADGTNAPLVVYSLEAPPGFPAIARPGDRERTELAEPVEVTGYGFKNLAYQAQRGISHAPLVLARSPEWHPVPALARRDVPGPFVIAVTVALCGVLALAIASLVYWQGRRASRVAFIKKRTARPERSAGSDCGCVLQGSCTGSRCTRRFLRTVRD
jgi:hypothetical protein